MGCRELPGWQTHPQWEGDAPQLYRDKSSCARGPHLSISSSGCSFVSFIISFNKLTNISVSLNFLSHSSKLIEPKKGVVGIKIYDQLVRNVGDNLDFQLASVVRWGSIVGLSP